MSTSMIAGGKIKILMHQKKPLPRGYVQDSEGNMITQAEEFYGPPREAIKLFGSELGSKASGFG